MLSILDLEFARVQIYWSLVFLVGVIIGFVVATKPNFIIIIDSLHEGRAVLHLHTPGKLKATFLNPKHLILLWAQILNQVIHLRFQIVVLFALYEHNYIKQKLKRLLSVPLVKSSRCC